jgi:hypothetical protein
MWSKIDDQFYLNVKNATIDRDEQDLYIAGNVYCNGQLTDGFIPAAIVAMLCIWAKIPNEANAQAIASRLVEHNYWELIEHGYMVHDFLDWNLSKAEVLELRAARSEAGRRGGLISAANRQASAQAKSKQNATQYQNPLTDKEHIEANASIIKPAKPSSPIVYTEGQKYLMTQLGAKRMNSCQAAAVLAMETTYGIERLKAGADWAAKIGMSLGKAITSMETALKKWDKPKPANNGNGSRPGYQTPQEKSLAALKEYVEGKDGNI